MRSCQPHGVVALDSVAESIGTLREVLNELYRVDWVIVLVKILYIIGNKSRTLIILISRSLCGLSNYRGPNGQCTDAFEPTNVISHETAVF